MKMSANAFVRLGFCLGGALAMQGRSATAQERLTDLMPGVTGYAASGTFEDVVFNLETAIVNRGLVIDYVSHVGEMLDRTGADVGADTKVFLNAQTNLFCSSVLSRAVMEADASAIAYCPYAIFAYETADEPGKVVVGYRPLPLSGASADAAGAVNDLLEEIALEAVAE